MQLATIKSSWEPPWTILRSVRVQIWVGTSGSQRWTVTAHSGCNDQKTRPHPRMDSRSYRYSNPKPWYPRRYSLRSPVLCSSLTIILTSNPYSRVIGKKTCLRIRRRKLRLSRLLRKIIEILSLGDVLGSSWSRSSRPNKWILSQLLTIRILDVITRKGLSCWYLHTERCFLRTWKRSLYPFLTGRVRARACCTLLTIRRNLNRSSMLVFFFQRMMVRVRSLTQETTNNQPIGSLLSGIKHRPMMPP